MSEPDFVQDQERMEKDPAGALEERLETVMERGSGSVHMRWAEAKLVIAALKRETYTPILFALGELSIWPGIAGVDLGLTIEADEEVFETTEEMIVIPPRHFRGVFEALREHVEHTHPSAVECIQAWQEEPVLKSEIMKLREKIEGLEEEVEELEDQLIFHRETEGDHL